MRMPFQTQIFSLLRLHLIRIFEKFKRVHFGPVQIFPPSSCLPLWGRSTNRSLTTTRSWHSSNLIRMSIKKEWDSDKDNNLALAEWYIFPNSLPMDCHQCCWFLIICDFEGILLISDFILFIWYFAVQKKYYFGKIKNKTCSLVCRGGPKENHKSNFQYKIAWKESWRSKSCWIVRKIENHCLLYWW